MFKHIRLSHNCAKLFQLYKNIFRPVGFPSKLQRWWRHNNSFSLCAYRVDLIWIENWLLDDVKAFITSSIWILSRSSAERIFLILKPQTFFRFLSEFLSRRWIFLKRPFNLEFPPRFSSFRFSQLEISQIVCMFSKRLPEHKTLYKYLATYTPTNSLCMSIHQAYNLNKTFCEEVYCFSSNFRM